MTASRPAYTVQLVKREDPKYGESWTLEFEGKPVVTRPSEAAARKAAGMYGWSIEAPQAERQEWPQ